MNCNRVLGAAILLSLCAAAPVKAPWNLTTKSDPMTDAKSVTLALRGPEESGFLLMCSNGDSDPLSVGFFTQELLWSQASLRDLTYRFDAKAPVVEKWAYGAHFVFRSDRVPAFISELTASKKLAIRTLNSRDGTKDFILDLTGAAAQVTKFKASCSAIGVSGL